MEDKELENSSVSVEETKPATKDPATLKLNYPRTLKVGLGFCVVMIFWQVYNFVVPLLLEEAFGFSNTVRNIIVGIASAMCIVLLPFFGGVSDRSGKSKLGQKYGRRTPFIVIGTVITIVAMILVPISVNQQLKSSSAIRDQYESFFSEDTGLIGMENPEKKGESINRIALLSSWFDEAKNGDYTHLSQRNYQELIETNDNSELKAKAFYVSLFNTNVSNGKLMSVIGTAKYSRKVFNYNMVTGQFDSVNTVEINEDQYNALNSTYMDYAKYVADSANDYISKAVNNHVSWGYFVFFLIALVLIIFAQTIIRTPAVSLMPDVTPSPLRSPGNAMINLIGGVGGAIGFFIYTITFMFDKGSFGGGISISAQYWIIFGTLAAALLVVLALFIVLVKEKKWVKECNETCKEYGLPTLDENADAAEIKKKTSLKSYGKSKLTSFFLILGAIFLWFIGYYAIANNLSVYCVKVLGISTGLASIVNGASLVVAAIGFIPVGIMARKIGRRWSIIFGFGLAVVSYVLVSLFVKRGSDAATIVFIICYMVSGFGLIFANVNTLPMVLEVSTPEDIGRFTGIYYIATMSAQTVGPILGGLVMDYIGGSAALFVFSAICVALGAVLMLFVKHGEAPDYLNMVAAKKELKLAKK